MQGISIFRCHSFRNGIHHTTDPGGSSYTPTVGVRRGLRRVDGVRKKRLNPLEHNSKACCAMRSCCLKLARGLMIDVRSSNSKRDW